MEELSEASWSGVVKAENVRPVVCATCLSSNRTLYPMFRMMHLSGVCNGVQLTPEDSVCWECRALLQKFALFKARAVNAKSTLTVWLQIYQIKNEPSPQQEATEDFDNHDLGTAEHVEDSNVDPKKGQIHKLIKKLLKKPNKKIKKKENIAEDDIESDVSADIKKDECFRVKNMTKAEMLQERERAKDYYRFKNAEFKCESCIKYFTSKELLDKHMVLHSESAGLHGCSICDLRFIGKGTLSLHVKSHYRYYECRVCNHRNPQRVNIIRHWYKHHNTAKKCTICKHEFRSSSHLKDHIKFSHEDDVTCKTCKKVFRNKYLLSRHMMIHTDSPSVSCDVCHKVFKGDWRLRAHKRVHENTANENAFCAECGVQFKNVYLYRVHLKTTARHVDPADRKFECSDCGKRFVAKTLLRLHIELVHLKKSNHTCDICGQSFNARLMLTRHKREKHTNRVKKHILCDICGKGFTVRKCLQEHKNVHSGLRPFGCALCAAAFSYSAALYNHTRLVHLKLQRGRNK